MEARGANVNLIDQFLRDGATGDPDAYGSRCRSD
jgi:hypothetical protein